ncbi:hypothetical protein HZ326_1366 [Fusarium oxysporum f. sp. albedinis]|nr:hypothetical protein HZ326_1366 [Fusarium oxysporum f. sp. albedinis]
MERSRHATYSILQLGNCITRRRREEKKKEDGLSGVSSSVNCFQPPSPQTRSISTPQKLHSEMSPQTHSQAVHGIPQIHKIKAIVSMG